MLISLLGAAALAAQAPASPPSPAYPSECAVSVYFGSAGAGIDTAAESNLNAYLAVRKDVTATKSEWRGREGEYYLCLKTEPSKAELLYRAVLGFLPLQSEKAPTIATLRGKAEP